MEIAHATLAQVRRGKNGRMIEVTEGVQDIARRVKEVDPNLTLHWNDDGGYFFVAELCRDGHYRLVTTAQEADQRLVDHLRKIGSEHWNAGAEMERHETERERNLDHKTHEEVGEKAEVLAHALRKDLNPSKIVVAKDIGS